MFASYFIDFVILEIFGASMLKRNGF